MNKWFVENFLFYTQVVIVWAVRTLADYNQTQVEHNLRNVTC